MQSGNSFSVEMCKRCKFFLLNTKEKSLKNQLTEAKTKREWEKERNEIKKLKSLSVFFLYFFTAANCNGVAFAPLSSQYVGGFCLF